jgi:hypothetical protein
MNCETKLSLLMKSLTEFYKDKKYVEEIQTIVDQNSIISLRILDWFITNYSKKYRTIIPIGDNDNDNDNDKVDVYMNYKLMLKSFSKKSFDPFCRKNKIIFYYTEEAENGGYIETSCGQLCFFRWCFENKILEYVKANLNTIEKDMKESLKIKKTGEPGEEIKKRQPLSISAARSVSKQNIKYTLKFD